MYQQEVNNNRIPDIRQYYILRNRNHLGINRLTFIRDKFKDQLMILAESEQMISKEVYVFLKENILVIEAPLKVDLERPYRTHLIGKKNLDEFNREDPDINFTEVRLSKKYYYNIKSFEIIKPGLLRILLSCWTAGSDQN
jgi:hypothetical protein